MARRCQCYGQCGRMTGRRRACVDSDLTGRCRGEDGLIHPRSDAVITISEMAFGPDVWVRLCQFCRDNFAAKSRLTPEDAGMIPLFPETT
jgi:hypothetical protein